MIKSYWEVPSHIRAKFLYRGSCWPKESDGLVHPRSQWTASREDYGPYIFATASYDGALRYCLKPPWNIPRQAEVRAGTNRNENVSFPYILFSEEDWNYMIDKTSYLHRVDGNYVSGFSASYSSKDDIYRRRPGEWVSREAVPVHEIAIRCVDLIRNGVQAFMYTPNSIALFKDKDKNNETIEDLSRFMAWGMQNGYLTWVNDLSDFKNCPSARPENIRRYLKTPFSLPHAAP